MQFVVLVEEEPLADKLLVDERNGSIGLDNTFLVSTIFYIIMFSVANYKVLTGPSVN